MVDGQFNNPRKFQVRDIACPFEVPSYKLAHLDHCRAFALGLDRQPI
jgi:hypothetical protein